MAALNPLSDAFGLDIGDRSFKLAQIQKTHNKKTPYRLKAWGEISVPEGVMENGNVLDVERAAILLERLVKESRGKLRGKGVVACLPEAKTFIKIIETDANITSEGLKRAVRREIEENIPLPQSEIYFDWQVLDGIHAEKGNDMHEHSKKKKTPKVKIEEKDVKDKEQETDANEDGKKKDKNSKEGEPVEEVAKPSPEKIRILLGAAPKVLVDSYTEMLERAGLAPVALEIEATAISRALMSVSDDKGVAVGILDIGATRSSLIIYDDHIIQMSISIPISGITITEAISKALEISMEDAEKLKIECGLDADRCEDKMWKILLPLIDDMAEKIRNALRFYHIGFPHGKKIEKMYLCGGGAHFKEVDTVLSKKLTIKVERGDALTNMHNATPKDFPIGTQLSYATAFGLGIRAADENKRQQNKFY